MKKLLAAIAVLLLGSSALARDDNGIGKLSGQKGKNTATKNCTKAAGKRTGKEREAFIEGCLSSSNESKRKSCSDKAKKEGMRGAKREEFLERCRAGQAIKNSGRSDH